jgi:hypothetical protein
VTSTRQCQLLTLDTHLSSFKRCGRRGIPTNPDGLTYRTVCSQHRAEVARVRAAGLAERLRWAEVEEVRP